MIVGIGQSAWPAQFEACTPGSCPGGMMCVNDECIITPVIEIPELVIKGTPPPTHHPPPKNSQPAIPATTTPAAAESTTKQIVAVVGIVAVVAGVVYLMGAA